MMPIIGDVKMLYPYRINSFWLQITLSQGAVSAGEPFSPLNQRL